MLVGRARVKSGDKVLIQAGASGVGVYAIQVAKLMGAHVAITASSAEKRRRCMDLGADIAWSYDEALNESKHWTDKRGVDIVLDHVGTDTWNTSVRALAKGGSLVTCGATTGHKAHIDLRVLFFKQLSLLGSTMGSMDEMCEAWRAVSREDIYPVVDNVLPMSQLAEAHRLLETRAIVGKVVVEQDL
jgi:NADPH:quinone reductase-like Zn-dependent oxidoreductase